MNKWKTGLEEILYTSVPVSTALIARRWRQLKWQLKCQLTDERVDTQTRTPAGIHTHTHTLAHTLAPTMEYHLSQLWWCRPVITACGRIKQEEIESKDSMGYKVRPCLKNDMDEPWEHFAK
jgi:hypothetical protein